MKKHLSLFLSFLLLMSIQSFSQEKKKETVIPIGPAKKFESKHSININGQTINYQVLANETYLHNEKEEPIASFWSVSYLKNEVKDYSQRPVMFIFNGGPGSASVWLHMGFFGPKVVQTDSEAKEDDGAAPFTIVDNAHSLLDLTDMVFVDPIGTGYSRVIGKGKEKDYWGLKEDANSVAEFMRKWITQHKRWQSPKYIAGESFGTTRAAAVSEVLEGGGQNMALNGLILISQALDYAGSTSTHDNITSYVTYLPSMAATAWYHKKAGQGKSLEEFVEESRQFTYNTYTPALYKGELLSDQEKEDIAEKLAYFTGLDKNYIKRSKLRILMGRFQKELLREEGFAIGRLDGRYFGDEDDDVAERPTLGDASSYQISSAYTAALNHYFAQDLKIEMNRPYLTSNGKLGSKWRWRTVPDGAYWEPSYVNTSRSLSKAMRRNPSMKVLVACGYYDLITPFFDAEYTFSRNGIPTDRVKLTYYEGGHMMYNHQPDFEQLAKDIREFMSK